MHMQASHQSDPFYQCKHSYKHNNRHYPHAVMATGVWAMIFGARISNAPVPLVLGLPMTIFAAGLDKSSKSPWSTASDKNATVVSKDALSRGDDLFEIPVRLNGLYPPACVCASALKT